MQSTGSEVDDMASARRQRVEGKERQATLSRKLNDMGKPMLADAQRHLELEDKTYQQRHDVRRCRWACCDGVEGFLKSF